MFDISLIPIFAATIFAVILSMFWYSRACFGARWAQEAHITSRPHDSAQEVTLASVLALFLQNFIVVYMLAHILLLARSYGRISPALACVWVILLVVASELRTVTLEQRSLSYAAITAGYTVVVISVATGIISLWPWV
jgi:hypothetical protein